MIQQPTSAILETKFKRGGRIQLTDYLAFLPTERVRNHRLLELWFKEEIGTYLLYRGYRYDRRRTPYSHHPLQEPEEIEEYEQYGQRLEVLAEQTPLINSDFLDFRYSERTSWRIAGFATDDKLSWGRFVLALAYADLKTVPKSGSDAVQDAWKALIAKEEFSPEFVNTVQQELTPQYYTIERNGSSPINIESTYLSHTSEFETIGQLMLSTSSDGNPFLRLNPTSDSDRLSCSSSYLILPDLSKRPPIPNYDELSEMSAEQLLEYFRGVAGIELPPTEIPAGEPGLSPAEVEN